MRTRLPSQGHWHHAMESLTDLLVFFYVIYELSQINNKADHRSVVLFIASMYFSAAASFFGAIYHMMPVDVTSRVQPVIWYIVSTLIGCSACCWMYSCCYAAMKRRAIRALLLFMGALQMVVYMVWTLFDDAFLYVIANYLLFLGVSLVLQIDLWTRGRPGAHLFVAAIAVTLVASMFPLFGIGLSKNFTANDLYHCIQLFSFFLMGRGASVMIDA